MLYKCSVCLTGVGYVVQVQGMFNRGRVCFKRSRVCLAGVGCVIKMHCMFNRGRVCCTSAGYV